MDKAIFLNKILDKVRKYFHYNLIVISTLIFTIACTKKEVKNIHMPPKVNKDQPKPQSLEGGVDSGGGAGVLCEEGGKEVVYLYDLWEGERLYGYKPYNHKIDDPLKFTKELVSKFPLPPDVDDADQVQEESDSGIQDFLKSFKFIKSDSKIVEIHDREPFILPNNSNCKLVQVAAYLGKDKAVINKNLFNKMSKIHQAALYLHELLYVSERIQGATNSAHTRKLVSQILSEKDYQFDVFDGVPKDGHIYCTNFGKLNDKKVVEFYIYPVKDNKLRFQFVRLGSDIYVKKNYFDVDETEINLSYLLSETFSNKASEAIEKVKSSPSYFLLNDKLNGEIDRYGYVSLNSYEGYKGYYAQNNKVVFLEVNLLSLGGKQDSYSDVVCDYQGDQSNDKYNSWIKEVEEKAIKYNLGLSKISEDLRTFKRTIGQIGYAFKEKQNNCATQQAFILESNDFIDAISETYQNALGTQPYYFIWDFYFFNKYYSSYNIRSKFYNYDSSPDMDLKKYYENNRMIINLSGKEYQVDIERKGFLIMVKISRLSGSDSGNRLFSEFYIDTFNKELEFDVFGEQVRKIFKVIFDSEKMNSIESPYETNVQSPDFLEKFKSHKLQNCTNPE